MLKNAVPISKKTQSVSISKLNLLILFGEIIAVQILLNSCLFKNHKNTLYGQSAELLNIKAGGTYSYRYVLKY
jgi:hypothetical protein